MLVMIGTSNGGIDMRFQYYADEVSWDSIRQMIKNYDTHEANDIRKAFNYYNGIQKILQKEAPEGRPNNTIVTNFCRQIVDTYQGFINLGKAVTDSETIEAALPVLSDILRDSLITGVAYGLAYYSDGELTFSKLHPDYTLVVRDTTIDHNVIGAVTWNKYTVYKNNRPEDLYDIYVYDDEWVYYYHGLGIDSAQLQEEPYPHYLNRVPIFEVHTDPHYDGIFKSVYSLQDSYNSIDSSYVDGRETFANSFLVLSGMSVTEDTADDMIDASNKILNLPAPGASASYLVKPDSAADVIQMLDNIKRRIFTIVSCPDFNDDKFTNMSGTALKNKLTTFINNVNNIEGQFDLSLLEIQDITGIDFTFTYTNIIPSDASDIVDQVVKLKDIVNHEVLVAQLPFVDDVGAAIL